VTNRPRWRSNKCPQQLFGSGSGSGGVLSSLPTTTLRRRAFRLTNLPQLCLQASDLVFEGGRSISALPKSIMTADVRLVRQCGRRAKLHVHTLRCMSVAVARAMAVAVTVVVAMAITVAMAMAMPVHMLILQVDHVDGMTDADEAPRACDDQQIGEGCEPLVVQAVQVQLKEEGAADNDKVQDVEGVAQKYEAFDEEEGGELKED
jgi:hypothetical protein